MGYHEVEWAGSRWGQVLGRCECGNKYPGPIIKGISWLAENLLTSQARLCSTGLIFVWPCIIETNNIDNQLDATVMVY
jgi:hypothetical protein